MLTKLGKTLGHPRHWLHDDLMRRLYKNAAVLFSGNMVGSLLGLASLALTARALGVEDFGILVLITTYVMVVDKLVNFQSWQAVIKYGADALEQKKYQDFKSLVKFGFVLDGATAILGTVISASAAWFVGNWLGWDEQLVLMAAIYSIVILFHIEGTPTGLLRLFDKFNKIAYLHVIASFIKLFGVSIVFFAGGGLWAFLLVWAVVDILDKLLLVYFAWQELMIRNFNGFILTKTSQISKKFYGIWRFVFMVNLQTAIKFPVREIDILLVGFLIGPSMSGGLKIIKQFSGAVGKITTPIFQVLLPEYSKLAAERNYSLFIKNIFKVSSVLFIISVGTWIGLILFSHFVIHALLGEEYIFIYSALIIFFIATIIFNTTLPLNPALLSVGQLNTYLFSTVVATVIYIPILVVFITNFGLEGAAIAWIIYAAIWSIISILYLYRFFVKHEILS